MTRPSLDDLTALALEAGREIMALRDGCEVIGKDDGSPVTKADQRAEEIIEAGLAILAPGVPVLAEEAVASGRIPDLGARFFCVDPLDGTKDFIEPGQSGFTVNIALIEDGAPTIGIVFAPATGEMYAGDVSHALAFKQICNSRAGEGVSPRETLAPLTPPDRTFRVITSQRSGANAATAAFLDSLGPFERVSVSSSIKFARLAEGACDLYPRLGPINWWDIAAGHAILRAVGGDAMTLWGAPLRYHGQPKLLDGFVAYAGARAEAAARHALTRLNAQSASS